QMTLTGMVSLAWVYRSATGISMVTLSPGPTSWPAIFKGCRLCLEASVIDLAGASGACFAMFVVLFDKADDLAGNILAGCAFDAFQARGGVDLHDDWSMIGTQKIHTGHVQPHDFGGANRGR